MKSNPILYTASLLILMLFASDTLYTQESSKRKVTPEEYHKWGTLWPEKISAGGSWASFTMRYHSGRDTLFVSHTSLKKRYSYPKGTSGRFGAEGTFALQNKDTLLILDLNSGKEQRICGVERYFFDDSGNYIIAYSTGARDLLIYTKDGTLLQNYGAITGAVLNQEGTEMVYCSSGNPAVSAGIIYFEKKLRNEILPFPKGFTLVNPVWMGNIIAFTSQGPETGLFAYHTDSKKMHKFSGSLPSAARISNSFGNLYISPDEKRIFFRLNSPAGTPTASNVQVWNSLDSQLYWNRMQMGYDRERDREAVWMLQTGESYILTDSVQRFMGLNGRADVAITAIFQDSITDGKEEKTYSVWAEALDRSWKRQVLEQHSGGELICSPDGNYILYYKQGHWWLYTIQDDKHACLTSKISIPFFKESHNKPSPAPAHGFGGWDKEGKSLLLYDQYDIWEFPVNGKSPRRLTTGREENRTYRILPTQKSEYTLFAFSNHIAGQLDLKKGFLLTTYDRKRETTGYSHWSRGGIEPLVAPDFKATHFYKAAKATGYIFMTQSFEVPRQLMYKRNKNAESTVVYGSNPQQSGYQWGSAEKIAYPYDDSALSAAIFYPPGFDKSRKYPMIVHVYERQAPYLNDYVIPTLYENTGFNYTNYVCEGYIVLLPDIIYKEGQTGRSAASCVDAALDAVIAKGFVDTAKIGLIGHSFGGYQTDIILTHTDRFRAAVSGAAWTDLVSAYLSIGTNTMTADYWRFEEDQLRLGTTIYKDYGLYLENSPVMRADKITTPLLSWVGSEDLTIQSSQSTELYQALRRLGKPHILLYYPGEQHALTDPANKKDLSLRIRQWFGYHLQGEEKQQWMLPVK